MKVENIKKINGNRLNFMITEDGADWEKSLGEASLALQKKSPLNGYRVGKAPLSAAISAYGGRLYELAGGARIPALFAAAVEENGFEPVGEPQINTVSCDADGLIFIVNVSAYPDVELGKYKGLEAERPDDTIDDADVLEQCRSFCDQHRIVNEVDRPARQGDIVYLDYSGTCEGKPFANCAMKDAGMRIGRDEPFPGLAALVVGMRSGEEREISLDIPPEHWRQDVAGKTVLLFVRVNQVKERLMPELTDALIARYRPKLGTVQAFRDDCRRALEERARSYADERFEANLMKALADEVKANIPDEMLYRQLNVQYSNLARGLAIQGKTIDGYLKEQGWTQEKLLEVSKPTAVNQIKLALAREEIARREKFEISERELEEEYVVAAREDNIDMAKAREKYDREQIAERILAKKADELVRRTAIPLRGERAAF